METRHSYLSLKIQPVEGKTDLCYIILTSLFLGFQSLFTDHGLISHQPEFAEYSTLF
jgi:hypothetical protein